MSFVIGAAGVLRHAKVRPARPAKPPCLVRAPPLWLNARLGEEGIVPSGHSPEMVGIFALVDDVVIQLGVGQNATQVINLFATVRTKRVQFLIDRRPTMGIKLL